MAQGLLFLVAVGLVLLLAIETGFVTAAVPNPERTSAGALLQETLHRAGIPDTTTCRVLRPASLAYPAEYESATEWAVVAVALTCLALAFLGWCMALVVGALRPRTGSPPRWAPWVPAYALCVLGAAVWVMTQWQFLRSQGLPALLIDTRFPPYGTFAAQHRLRGFLDGLGVACIFAALLACAVQVIPTEERWTAPVLRRRIQTLQFILIFGAILLSVGVLEIWALFDWALLPIPANNTQLHPILDAARVGVGSLSSLALLIAYVPPLLYLRGSVAQLAASQTANPAEADAWLTREGLALKFWEPLLHVTTALAPLVLSGPVAALVKQIGK